MNFVRKMFARKEKENSYQDTEAAFQGLSLTVAFTDLLVGSSILISIVSTLIQEKKEFPLFQRRPSPKLEEFYESLSPLMNPYRNQYMILGLILGSGLLGCFGIFLGYSVWKRNRVMIQIWTLVNMFFTASYACFMLYLALFTSYAFPYAFIGVLLPIFRWIQIWIVGVYLDAACENISYQCSLDRDEAKAREIRQQRKEFVGNVATEAMMPEAGSTRNRLSLAQGQ